MDEYLISKAGLTELLNRYDKNELQEVYRLCLEDKVKAHNHHEIAALLILILKFKWDEFTQKHTKIDFYFNLKNFKDNNEVFELYRLFRRTNFEIGLTIASEGDPIDEKHKVEFLELYSTFLFMFFAHFKCIDLCNCALIREPDNSTINLFKASLLDLALIVKHNNRYDYGINMLRKEMLSNVDVRKTNFDKEITKRILTDNLILAIEPYWKKKIFGFFTIPENIMETDLGEKYWSSELDYYLKNVLFLNPLNNFGRYAQASFEELQSISLSDENKKMFDSIIDDYKFCRRKVFEFDSLGTLSKREMCSVYCFLYLIFDKVAFLLKNVYEINVEEDIVDFTQGKLFDRKYKNSDKKFYEISNPAIIPIYLESVEGRSKNNIKGLDVGTFELNEFRNTLEHRSTSLIDENKLKGNLRILIKKIRNLILETYILLQSADTNMNSDDIVLCGTAYAKAIEAVNNSQNGI